ncbi:MAG: hypothetical protein LUD47_04395 [Clostridia bacterium]|nr:hypothetical protein [Clostridia bacterium]
MAEDIFEKLDEMSRGSAWRFGTEAERILLDALGSPDEGLKIIHIAGTNGKGSVCAYLTAALTAAGMSCGTYTSPAVFGRCEQYLMCGVPCAERLLKRILSEVYGVAETLDPRPSAFEIETAAAFLLFYRENMEWAVVECGLGGLLDATNAATRKEFALITSIGLEHTEILGGTIPEICAHKAGIIRNCPAIISCDQPKEALEYFSGYTSVFSGDGLEFLSRDGGGQRFSYDGEEYSVRMPGREQCFDACLAVDCLRAMHVPMYAIKEGLSVAKIPGRCDIRRAGEKTYILDGAHNVPAFGPLKELLKTEFGGHRTSMIFGCLSDKDLDGVTKEICGLAEEYIAVRPQSDRAQSLDTIAEALRKNCGQALEAGSVSEALAEARGEVVVVCGTFTILKEAEEWIKNAR